MMNVDGSKVHAGRVKRTMLVLALAAAWIPAGWPHDAARAASLTEVTGFGSNPGNLQMFKYVPDGLPSGAPLVVLLHGCTQSAASYDAEPGWTKYADLWDFALVLPQQRSSNNSSSCFNWFENGDITRGQGEALSIKQMVDKMKTDHGVAASRVYVSGLSSGGAMTSVMLATYPDVFSGGAVIAGIPYRCGIGLSAGFSCMNPGRDRTPAQWGNDVRAASSHTGPWPKVAIWHGSSDSTVSPSNMTESMEQWTNVHGIDQVPDVEDTVKGYPHKVYKNASGVPLVETYSITGMGHGTPVDPGSAQDQCGTAGAYILDVNICSSYFIAKFFGLDDTDATAPTVSITSPSQGATVSGTVTIQASPSDNVGVARVEFFVDGALLDTDPTSPYTASWNTANESNGSHTLTAKAFDAAGNVGTSAAVTVNVTGGIDDTTAPTVNLTFPSNGDTVHGTVTLSATASDDVGVTRVEFFIDGASIGTGTAAGPAGPWQLSWNTTSVADGSHAIKVEARDAKGNVGVDNDTTVTVDQPSFVLDETFSDLDGDGDAPDDNGWALGGYEESSDNHTVGPAGSESLFGYGSSGTGCQTGWRSETLSRSVTLGDAPVLTYWRKLDLKALINISTSARFRVTVGGTVVDEKVVTYANYTETAWTERANIDLGAWANTTRTIAFEAAAYSNVCMEAWGKAWVDDITIGTLQADDDTVAPTVNVTAPVNAATVSGTVDITASASDNVSVTKVEFFVDGTLLGVDTHAPFELSWDTTAVADGTHELMAVAYDAAGNAGTDDDTSVTVANSGGGSPTTVTFSNIDAEDGYVKANQDGSGSAVGTLESTYGLAIGRGSDGKDNRTILSFDTASIPDTATIARAYLTVKHNSSSGDPWASPAGNELVIDVKTGCFGGCTIASSDWAAAATASAVGKLVKFTSGSQNSTEFNAAGRSAINRTGRTQLKLRFSSFQTVMAYLFIKRGADATLTVEFTT